MAGGQWAGSSRRGRLPDDWPKIRNRVLKRDGRICHICHASGADGVDHVIPGDDHSEANLRAVHHNVEPYCHRAKSSAEGGRAAQAKRIPRSRPAEKHPGML
jgi:5-methylcytosine-specific restriction protein A